MTSRQVAFLGFGILVLVPAVFFLVRSDDAIINTPPKNQRVVVFGDSLVEGVGATTEKKNFVSLVSEQLHLEIVNKGKSGDTTEGALSRVDEVLAGGPGVVVILLGGNDVIRRIPKKETFANLSTIIERVEQSGAAVVLLGVRGGILGDGYEKDYHALAKKYHTAYVPNILEGLIGDARYMYDGIHPNDQGYAIIANRVAEVLWEVLL